MVAGTERQVPVPVRRKRSETPIARNPVEAGTQQPEKYSPGAGSTKQPVRRRRAQRSPGKCVSSSRRLFSTSNLDPGDECDRSGNTQIPKSELWHGARRILRPPVQPVDQPENERVAHNPLDHWGRPSGGEVWDGYASSICCRRSSTNDTIASTASIPRPASSSQRQNFCCDSSSPASR